MVFECYRWNTVYYQWSWRSEKKHKYLNLFKRWLGPSILLRCIYGCQKWIPDKIPHRYGCPKNFSTFFFVEKDIFWKWNWNKKLFRKICLLIFQKYIFFHENKKLRFFLDYHIDVEFCQESISGIHKCNVAVLKALNTVKQIQNFVFFIGSSTSPVVYSISSVVLKDQNYQTH